MIPRSRSPRAALGALLGAAGLIAALPLSAQEPSPLDSAALRQVEVGEQWFRSVCLECHAQNLSDPDFRLKWGGRSAYDLFDQIRTTMPESDPGSLTPETYTAVIAYLMKRNGMPVAPAVLSADSAALAAVKLTFPPSTR